MKSKVRQDKIVLTGILNESLMESVVDVAKRTKCKIKWEDQHTTAIITGDLNLFIKEWNNL